MTMRLLSPQETKQKRAVYEESEKRTLVDLEHKIELKRRELIAVEEDGRRVKKSQDEGIEERNRKIIALNAEITELERQRKRDLIPVEELRKDLEKELEKAKYAAQANDNERKISERQRITYINALETLEDERHDVLVLKENLDRREKGITLEEAEVNRLSKELADRIQKHTEDVHNRNAEFAARERQLKQREHSVSVLQKEVDQDRIDLEKREKALQDKYATFERAQKRLEKN